MKAPEIASLGSLVASEILLTDNFRCVFFFSSGAQKVGLCGCGLPMCCRSICQAVEWLGQNMLSNVPVMSLCAGVWAVGPSTTAINSMFTAFGFVLGLQTSWFLRPMLDTCMFWVTCACAVPSGRGQMLGVVSVVCLWPVCGSQVIVCASKCIYMQGKMHLFFAIFRPQDGLKFVAKRRCIWPKRSDIKMESG